MIQVKIDSNLVCAQKVLVVPIDRHHGDTTMRDTIVVLFVFMASCALPHARVREGGLCFDPSCSPSPCPDGVCEPDADDPSDALASSDVIVSEIQSVDVPSSDGFGDSGVVLDANEASVDAAVDAGVDADVALDAGSPRDASIASDASDAADAVVRPADVRPPYPAYYGCSTSADCASGLICISFVDGRFRACAPPCMETRDCPMFPGNPALVPTCAMSRGRCLLTCTGPGSCPPGVECVPYPSGGYGYCS